jgi:NADPH-dependent 2,4-dienoyl-CoA reductase/sulfur reductase-like enzyme
MRNRVPPIQGIDKVKFHTLRHKKDYAEINKALREEGVKSVTIIGAGFIGL